MESKSLRRLPKDLSYYQRLAQKKCPAAIKVLSDAMEFLDKTWRDESLEMSDRIKAAVALVKPADTIIRAAGVYQPNIQDISMTVESLPLIQIMLANPEPKLLSAFETPIEINGVVKS